MRFVPTAFAILLAGASIPLHAQSASDGPHASPDAAARRTAMVQLMPWAGEWSGEGWFAPQGRERFPFTVHERIEPKLGGQALLVQGLGKDAAGAVVHDALAIISYDPATHGYLMRFQTAAGMAGDAPLAAVDGGWRWGFEAPGGVQVRFTLSVEGDSWHERGEASPDGGARWFPIHEMKLRRVARPVE